GKYTFRIVLTKGLNRQIRRMCTVFGYQVKSLKRVRVLNILLKDLKPGQYRQIEGDELTRLYTETRVS
ncbi:MAG: 23S rRNA pseudouridine synthase F, partial [Lachnospiraceae bacterium]|nr:23S rRNA pseudouridine synthase F [Lachnospiraceae bacterium]